MCGSGINGDGLFGPRFEVKMLIGGGGGRVVGRGLPVLLSICADRSPCSPSSVSD